MTGFDILLCGIIAFMISWIIAIKKFLGKPQNGEDWLISIILALLIILITTLCIILIYFICVMTWGIIYGIFTSINWHNFFTQKVI